jgi:hypothetical protein
MRGFILQPTYRIESRRPVVHLWGRLESGETFLVRDRRLTPHFFVRQEDREAAARLGAAPLAGGDQRTLNGEAVLRVEVPTPPETPALRDRLEGAGVVTFQADVRFASTGCTRIPISLRRTGCPNCRFSPSTSRPT